MTLRLLMIILISSNFLLAKAQYSMGLSGQLNIPTAEIPETGTFMGGFNFLPKKITPNKFDYNTLNYFVNITLFSFLELNYKCTLLKTEYMSNKARYREQDRSFSAKLRLWKENKYIPSIAVGVNDPLKQNKNYFASIYGVITKNITAIKYHQFSLSFGYYHALNNYSIQDGIFGGFCYTPAFLKKVSLMGEYDSSGLNLGAAAKLWNRISLHLYTRQFKCISGGIRYEYTLIH